MRFLSTGPPNAPATLLLAHGAGAPMDSPFMNALGAALAERGLHAIRFEFDYMAGRRSGGGRKPPPRADRLMPEYRAAVDELASPSPLFIGGKSMGGRVATMVAEELFGAGRIAGLVCLGYPFHPPARPQQTRTAHLEGMSVPALICQGSRDPFGTREEVAEYDLSPSIRIRWLENADHDLRSPRGSGRRQRDNLDEAADAIAGWIGALVK